MTDLVRNTFFDSVAIEEISLASWRAIFGATVYPSGLSKTKLSHESVAEALVGKELSPELVDALQTNLDLGDELGREAIVEAAGDQGLDATRWPKDEAPRDLVARLWVEQRSRSDVARVLMRAQMRVHGTTEGERNHRAFTGKDVRPLANPFAFRGRLAKELADFCFENGRDRHAEVRACQAGSVAYFELIHGHRVAAPLVVDEGGRRVLKFRPAHCDSVRYDPATGLLGIAARSQAMVPFYRRTFGKVLFGDADFFPGEDVCTLRPLQERGRAALEAHRLNGRIARVRMVECHWQHGEERYSFAAPDCFDSLARRGLRTVEGTLVHAKLAFTLVGKRSRRKTVSVKVPNRIDYRRDADEELIETYLKQVGIQRRGIASGTEDFWSMYPWIHPEGRWRLAYGRDVDRMVQAGILVPDRRTRVEHPDHPAHPAPLRAEELPDGSGTYGVSEDEAVASRTLTATDVGGLRFEPKALAQAVAHALELKGAPKDIDDETVFDLGVRDFGSTSIRVYLTTREPRTGHALGSRLNTGAPRAVMLVPEGRETRTGVPEVELGSPSGPYDGLLRSIIDALDLHAHVPANACAPEGARLVVDPNRGESWYDGVALSAVGAETYAFRFMALVAAANGGVVTADQIRKALAPARTDDTFPRRAKKEALDGIKESFSRAGKEAPADVARVFTSRGGGYFVTVSAYVVPSRTAPVPSARA